MPGDLRAKTVALEVTDKDVARERLRNIVRRLEREAAGVGVPKHLQDAAQKNLSAHMEDFLADLLASGRDDMYQANLRCRLTKLFKDCDWHYPKDVTADGFMAWRSKQTLAAKTLNDYLDAANGLMKWMKRAVRIEENALQAVGKVKTAGRETVQRRALSDNEVQRLLEVAGPRKPVYLTALNTGLRRAELAALQKGDCSLYGDYAFLKVRASTTKNSKAATIWLNDEVAAELKKLVLPGVDSTESVFESIPDMDQFRYDLAAAKIPYVDEHGRRADFHALRHTLATNLARCGVLPRVAMEFMRHSEMRLTNKTYTDVAHLPLAEAAEMLPQFLKGHDTQRSTQETGAAGHMLAHAGINQIRAGEQKSIDSKGESHVLSLAGTDSQENKLVHASGVEPETF
ncbi:MAG TPA: tyrosine-type recombinase/integrase [Candidatus Acidoferrales bacterium]|nr:tyrosine-type recombinase/integrase [Candidatus Acidoferrales bacterium]